MSKRPILAGLTFLGLLAGGGLAFASEDGSSACIQEIERVCAGLESHLETCLADRGARLSGPCRDQLQTAMAFKTEDSTGPASCVADASRLCPGLQANALGACMAEKFSQFSEPCQKYMQEVSQNPGARQR